MKNWLLKISLMMSLVFPLFALAQTGNSLLSVGKYSGWYNQNNPITIRFSQPTFVDKVITDMVGHNRFTEVHVYADGEYVANLGVPGHDPRYPIVVRKRVSKIEFVFHGSVRVDSLSVYGNYGEVKKSLDQFGFNGDMNTPSGMATSALIAIEELESQVIDSSWRKYLKPIRQAALRLQAVSQGRSEFSEVTRNRAIVLLQAIKYADGYLETLTDVDSMIPAVTLLWTVAEKIDYVLEVR